jgi:hypothetical protein
VAAWFQCQSEDAQGSRSSFCIYQNLLPLVYINLLSYLLLVVVDLFESLAAQGPKKTFVKKHPAHSVHHSAPLVGVVKGLGMHTT